MKPLKCIGYSLLAIIALFLLVGVIFPSFEYQSHVVVNAPLEQSWAVFSDAGRMAEWLPGFKSIETLSGSPNQVGSTYKMVFEEEGEVMEMTEYVTAFRDNELFAFELNAEPMIATVQVKFSGNRKMTEILAITKVEGKNLLWKSLLRLSKSRMVERGQETYDNLKRIIEASDSKSGGQMVEKH